MARERDEKGAMASQTTEKFAMARQTTEKGAKARLATVKTLPRTTNWAGGRDEERRIEGQRKHYDKRNRRQNPPAGHHRGGGRGEKEKVKTNTGWKGGTTHSPARGGSAWLNACSKEETKYHASQENMTETQSCATV